MRFRIVAQFAATAGLFIASTVLAASAYAATDVPTLDQQAPSRAVTGQSGTTVVDVQSSSDAVKVKSVVQSSQSSSTSGPSSGDSGGATGTSGTSSVSSASGLSSPNSNSEPGSPTTNDQNTPSGVVAHITVTAVVPVTPQNSLNLTQLRQTITQTYQNNVSSQIGSAGSGHVQDATLTPAPMASSVPQSPSSPALPVGTLSFLQQINAMLASTFVPALQLVFSHAHPKTLSVAVGALLVLSLILQLLCRSRQGYAMLLAAGGHSNAPRGDTTYALNTLLAQARAEGATVWQRTSAFLIPWSPSSRLSPFDAGNADRIGLSTAACVYGVDEVR